MYAAFADTSFRNFILERDDEDGKRNFVNIDSRRPNI